MRHRIGLAFIGLSIALGIAAPLGAATGPESPLSHALDSACAISEGIACVRPEVQLGGDDPVRHAVDAAFAILRSFAAAPHWGWGSSSVAMEAR